VAAESMRESGARFPTLRKWMGRPRGTTSEGGGEIRRSLVVLQRGSWLHALGALQINSAMLCFFLSCPKLFTAPHKVGCGPLSCCRKAVFFGTVAVYIRY
jgi:hypothetical protein